MTIADGVGSAGVGVLLVAFLLNLAGYLSRDSRVYHGLNFAGAGAACYASILIGFLPFVVLEGVWSLAALAAIVAGPRSTESS